MFLLIIQQEFNMFCCSHTDIFEHDLSCIYYRLSQVYRSSHQRCSIQKSVLKTLAIFMGGCSILKPVFKFFCSVTLKQNLFFNKVLGLQTCNFIKKRLQHRCFPVNIKKFLRTFILKNICK